MSAPKSACDACRSQKIRCDWGAYEIGAQSQCTRCAKLHLECTVPYGGRKRGRPSKSMGRGTDSPGPQPTDARRDLANSSRPTVQILTPLVGSENSAYTSPPLSRARLDLSGYLDPSISTRPQLPFYRNVPLEGPAGREEASSHPATEMNDPVALRIVSIGEASWLLEQFMDHLNPLVAIFDRHLHSVEYLSRNPVLFSAILAASARMFRTELLLRLQGHADVLLERALSAGRVDIGVVQALMLMTYYKDPTDTTSWQKIGIAMRMAYQLGWHIKRSNSLPANELEARHVLNVERSWICLFCFDQNLAQTFSLPTTIKWRELPDPECWAREHLHLGNEIDMHLAASIELSKLKTHWLSLFTSGTPPTKGMVAAIRQNVLEQCYALKDKWFQDITCPAHFAREREQLFKWCILDLVLVLLRHGLAESREEPSLRDRALMVSEEIIVTIEKMAANKDLGFVQDTSSCLASSQIVFLQKLYPSAPTSMRAVIIAQLQRLTSAYSAVSEGQTESAPAYVARFAKRILTLIKLRSMPGSPNMNASASLSPSAAPYVPDAMEDVFQSLDSYLANMPDLGSPSQLDADYW